MHFLVEENWAVVLGITGRLDGVGILRIYDGVLEDVRFWRSVGFAWMYHLTEAVTAQTQV